MIGISLVTKTRNIPQGLEQIELRLLGFGKPLAVIRSSIVGLKELD
jgi:hypothetical protein